MASNWHSVIEIAILSKGVVYRPCVLNAMLSAEMLSRTYVYICTKGSEQACSCSPKCDPSESTHLHQGIAVAPHNPIYPLLISIFTKISLCQSEYKEHEM